MKRTFALIALAFLILVVSQGGHSHTATYLAAAPHRWSLLQWEASNFLDKWWHRTVQAIPWYSPPVPPEEAAARFFELTEQIDHLQSTLTIPITTSRQPSTTSSLSATTSSPSRKNSSKKK